MKQQNINADNNPTDENLNNQHSRRSARLKRFIYATLAVVGIVTTSTAVVGCNLGHKWKDASVAEKVELISEHLADVVDANDQQQSEIELIIGKYEPSLTLMHDNHQDHKTTIINIFKQEKFSETDLESARVAIFELLNQDSMQLTKMIAEIANVLTLEQRMALIEKIEKRHHRHHF